MPYVHLAVASVEAALRQQGGLLVDDLPSDGHLATEHRRVPNHGVAVDDRGQRLIGEPEEFDQPRMPAASVQVDEQRPAGGRHIGDESPGQPVQQPTVGGGDNTVAGHVSPQPSHLRRGKVGVENQPSQLRHLIGLVRQVSAHLRSTTVLPHHRWRQRFPTGPIPGQYRLALVGQSNCSDRRVGCLDGPVTGRKHRFPEFFRVLFHAAAVEVVRPDRLLCHSLRGQRPRLGSSLTTAALVPEVP